MEGGARNIQQYVARCAVLYAKDREKLKRRLDALEEALTYCIKCGHNFYLEKPSLSGECNYCGIYLACQYCSTERKVCHMCGEANICANCLQYCSCELVVCPKCSPTGECCFYCFRSLGARYVPCSKRPFSRRVLANGYSVPLCDYHSAWREERYENTEVELMLKFFGIIHKLEKRAKVE